MLQAMPLVYNLFPFDSVFLFTLVLKASFSLCNIIIYLVGILKLASWNMKVGRTAED